MHRIRLHGRIALSCLALATLALVGGCSKSDSKSGGGGSSGYAAPPTARPSLTGMAAVIDAGGADGIAQGDNGRDGGDIDIYAQAGRLLPSSSMGAASIDDNFLAGAGTTITYTNLAAISAAVLQVSGSVASFDLPPDQDFYLPAGSTLDLSDAPSGMVNSVVIRTHGTGGRIRIDGTVVTARASAPTPDFSLVTSSANGVAIDISGSISTQGSSGIDGGALDIFAMGGSIRISGSLNTRGGAGGDGNDVYIESVGGDVGLAAGMITSNGGNGVAGTTANGGAGGDGGDFFVLTVSSSESSFNWGLVSNGGTGANTTGTGVAGTGGSGGSLDIEIYSEATFFLPYTNMGGGSNGGDGGAGGDAQFYCGFAHGVIDGDSSGGDATGTPVGNGGNSGQVSWDFGAVSSMALVAVSNGGDGAIGGDSPNENNFGPFSGAQFYCDDDLFHQVLVDFTGRGGTGTTAGGDGGTLTMTPYEGIYDVTIVSDMDGGAASAASGVGGNGGYTRVKAGGNYIGVADNVTVTVTARGGNATAAGGVGGAGGLVNLSPGDLGMSEYQLTLDATGGNGSDAGGAGGVIEIDKNPFYGTLYGHIAVHLVGCVIDGGSGSVNNGGSGGTLYARVNGGPTTTGGAVEISGDVSMRGGVGLGTATGGSAATITLGCGDQGWFIAENLSIDARGGDSLEADGGTGATLTGFFAGTLRLISTTVDTSGGIGGSAATNTTAVGGDSGQQSWYGIGVDVYLMAGSVLRSNGGGGDGGGGDSNGVRLYGDFGSLSGYVFAGGRLEANGGNATVDGDGGQGNEALCSNISGPPSAITEFTGQAIANGGNGAGTGNGGRGGLPQVTCNGQMLTMSGTMSANGGTGVVGGDGYLCECYGGSGCNVQISGTMTANGGTGTVTGGAGGSMDIGRVTQVATVTFSGTAGVNGGTGGTTGGNGGSIEMGSDTGGSLTISGTITANGGTGAAGGNGGSMVTGTDVCDSITVTATGVLRANGAATDGDGGSISLNPVGTAGANVTQAAGSVVEANADGAGTAGTVTID